MNMKVICLFFKAHKVLSKRRCDVCNVDEIVLDILNYINDTLIIGGVVGHRSGSGLSSKINKPQKTCIFTNFDF